MTSKLAVEKEITTLPVTTSPIYCPSCHVKQPLVVKNKCTSCGKTLPTPTSQFARVRPARPEVTAPYGRGSVERDDVAEPRPYGAVRQGIVNDEGQWKELIQIKGARRALFII